MCLLLCHLWLFSFAQQESLLHSFPVLFSSCAPLVTLVCVRLEGCGAGQKQALMLIAFPTSLCGQTSSMAVSWSHCNVMSSLALVPCCSICLMTQQVISNQQLMRLFVNVEEASKAGASKCNAVVGIERFVNKQHNHACRDLCCLSAMTNCE